MNKINLLFFTSQELKIYSKAIRACLSFYRFQLVRTLDFYSRHHSSGNELSKNTANVVFVLQWILLPFSWTVNKTSKKYSSTPHIWPQHNRRLLPCELWILFLKSVLKSVPTLYSELLTQLSELLATTVDNALRHCYFQLSRHVLNHYVCFLLLQVL